MPNWTSYYDTERQIWGQVDRDAWSASEIPAAWSHWSESGLRHGLPSYAEDPINHGSGGRNRAFPEFSPDMYMPPEESFPEDDYYGDEGSYDDGSEVSDDDVMSETAKLPEMVIPALDNRPARLVSLEQEVGGEAHTVARELYDAGQTNSPDMQGYHCGSGNEFCRVEDDSSVDGEIIYSRMRLNHTPTARRLEDCLDVVGDALRARTIRLDSRCGFHIHVDLGADISDGAYKCYSAKAMVSLYHLWNHLEDTIYRLASANWSKHRTELAYHNYAPKTVKGLRGSRDIGLRMERERGALNLANFLASRSYCSCGAFGLGEWEKCDCSLEQPTVEFRVFNATANKRKIRAYVALCLAMVAYCEANEVTDESHPPLEWGMTDAMDTASNEDRLRFILRELPLTDQEREDIRYCAEKSSLKDTASKIRRRKGYDRKVVTA